MRWIPRLQVREARRDDGYIEWGRLEAAIGYKNLDIGKASSTRGLCRNNGICTGGATETHFPLAVLHNGPGGCSWAPFGLDVICDWA